MRRDPVGGDCGRSRTGAAGVTAGRQRRRRCIAALLLAFTPVFIHPVDPADERRAGHGGVDAVLPVLRDSHRRACFDSAAGIACAIAVLIRPNLAPLAIVPLRPRAQPRRIFDSGRDRRRVARLSPVALVRIAVAIRIWLGRGVVRAREHRPQCVAVLQLAGRDRADPVPGGLRLLCDCDAIALRRALFAFASLVIGVVPGLRRLRRLVVPALPAAGDGGAGGVRGG